MNTTRPVRGLCLLGGMLILLVSPRVNAQDTLRDGMLESLIERLEAGLSALTELERHEEAGMVEEILVQLREQHAGIRQQRPREENEEIRTVRRRIAVMRTAVKAFVEADRHDWAERVEQAMHARELSIEGRRDDEANRIRETAPNRGQLAELLKAASDLYGSWGMPDRAEALADLSNTYGQQWRRRQEAQREGRVTERESDIEDLNHRIEILGFAHKALEEAGHEEWTHTMGRFIRVAEMQRAGVTGPEFQEAVQGLSMGMTIELLQKASGLWAEWGWETRAGLCNDLAEYYAARERARGQEGGEQRDHEPEGDLEDQAWRTQVIRFARNAHREAGHGDAADLLEQAIHVGELQLSGASGEEILAAFEGLSMELITELVLGASKLYHDWGNEGRSSACYHLAEYYMNRGREEGAEQGQEEGREWGKGGQAQVSATLHALHRHASEANGEAYFALFAPDATYYGTASEERWSLAEFQKFAAPYFGAGRGWTYEATERHVFLDDTGDTAWFDERLHNEKYGEVRGTGVLRQRDGQWRIVQYNLTFPVPNEVAPKLIELIRGDGG